MSCLIDQISIFVENRPGKLAAIAEVMEAQMINFLAFSIAEADGFGLVRAVVDDPQSAQKVMRELGPARPGPGGGAGGGGRDGAPPAGRGAGPV